MRSQFLPAAAAKAARTWRRAQGCFLLPYGPSPVRGDVYLFSHKCENLLKGNTKHLFDGGLSSHLFSLFLRVSSGNCGFPENLDQPWDQLCHFGFALCTQVFIVNFLKGIPEGKNQKKHKQKNNEASSSKAVKRWSHSKA